MKRFILLTLALAASAFAADNAKTALDTGLSYIHALDTTTNQIEIKSGTKLHFQNNTDRVAFSTELGIAGGVTGVHSVNGLDGTVVFNFNPGKNVLVDATNGNDATGLRGRLDKPFLTLAAARTAAASGDTILVSPGSYNENNLLKTGVNWNFASGAVVSYSGSGRGGIFDDSANGANAAITSNISGHGRFVWSSSYAGGPSDECGGVFISNASSVVNIEADSFDTGSAAADLATAVFFKDGTSTLHCREITTSEKVGLWWEKGPCRVTCDQVTATGSGLAVYTLSPSDTPTGAFFLKAHQIKAASYNAIQVNSDNATTQTWIETLEAVSDYETYQAVGGKNYLTAQKVSTTTAGSYAFYIYSGKVYANVEKIAGQALRTLGSGTTEVWLTAMLMDDDTASTDNSIDLGATTIAFIKCLNLKTTAANGLKISSSTATCDFWGRIDTSAASSKNPILFSAAGDLRLHETLLLPNGSRDSIETSSASPTVTSYGSYGKTTVDSAVTLVGDFTVNSSFK